MVAYSLDGIWDFCFFENEAIEEIALDRIVFRDIMCVPGSFDVLPDCDGKRGTGVYRRFFELDAEAPRPLLRIEGFGLRAEIIVDRKIRLLPSSLPYSTVELELPPLTSGRHEIIALIDNRFDREKVKLFLSGYDFYAFGGFYRGVSLLSRPAPFSLDRVQVRTVDYKSGAVALRFRFSGKVPEEILCDVKFDTESEFRRVKVVPGKELVCEVPGFRLWSPEEPGMHSLTVRCCGDTRKESFGIRTVETGNKEILINGKPVYLKGFNRHESHPEFGAAVPMQIMLEDLQNMRRMGCNFVRGCHYPQSRCFLDLCDRMGFLVWEESLGWGNKPPELADSEFGVLQMEQTVRMIEEDFNHPSIILWAFMNEFFSNTTEGYALAEKLVKSIKENDSSRPVTFACSHWAEDICCELCDVIAFNTYPGWIEVASDSEPEELIPERIKTVVERFRRLLPPEKPLIVGEMGACAEYGRRDRAAAQWTEEFQAGYLDAVIRTVFDEPEICGLTIWQLNDSKSYCRKGGMVRVKPFGENLAGVFDRYRRPKLSAEVVRRHFMSKAKRI